MLALVLAGGRGLRLTPYTRVLPKPLLPVGDRPVLALLLDRLHLAGIRRVVISLGYLGDLIRTYFGNGEWADMEVSYLVEKEPLGTAGPIRLLPRQEEAFFVINGDIVTDLPFADLYRAHREEKAVMTVAAREHRFRLEYGLLRTAGQSLVAWEEKPCLAALIGIGVYVVEPEVQDLCPPGRVEMPELVRYLLAAGHRVAVYPTEAYWRDIGTPEEYHALNESPPDFVRRRRWPEGGKGFAARERDHTSL